jgi:hypothetical protein
MDLDNFANIDPDDVYTSSIQNNTPWITFIYTPDGKLWEREGDTHYSMMVNSWQGNRELLKSIWGFMPRTADADDQEYGKPFTSVSPTRKQSLQGRIGLIAGQTVIALHNSLNDPMVKPFLEKLKKQHPEFKKGAVITSGLSKPILWGNLSPKTISAPIKTRYKIDNKIYTRGDFAQLLSAWHTQPWKREELKAILCHPDIQRYHDLSKIMPPGCEIKQPKKSMWQAMKQAMPIESTQDLSKFKLSPNDLMMHGINFNSPLITFIFSKNGKLHLGQGDYDTHYDLMKKSKVQKDIWGDKPITSTSPFGWSQQDIGSLGVMGRASFIEGQPIISVWSDAQHPLFRATIEGFIKKFPHFEDAVVVGCNDEGQPLEPILLGDLKKATVSAPVMKDSYVINGKKYDRNEIGQLMSAWHTQPWKREELKSILCHPDMSKYPELSRLIPPGCDPPKKQKSWYQAIKQNFPVETTLNFKEWLDRI